MPRIRLLKPSSTEPVDMGIFKIVGEIRGNYKAKEITLLSESQQGTMMHGLLQDLASDRGKKKGTKIKNITYKMGADNKTIMENKGATKWVHNGHAVMHYSTGDKNQDSKTHSATIFFYESGADIIVIAAGHHINNSADYKVVWGANAGGWATVG